MRRHVLKSCDKFGVNGSHRTWNVMPISSKNVVVLKGVQIQVHNYYVFKFWCEIRRAIGVNIVTVLILILSYRVFIVVPKDIDYNVKNISCNLTTIDEAFV